MVSISKGGPGSMSTWVPSASKAQPGAVPTGLSKMTQSAGNSACWRLFSGMVRCTFRAKYARMPSSTSSRSTSGLPKAAQTVCFVRSS